MGAVSFNGYNSQCGAFTTLNQWLSPLHQMCAGNYYVSPWFMAHGFCFIV
jgi:hypothetical protein